jgi:hypothetical protein
MMAINFKYHIYAMKNILQSSKLYRKGISLYESGAPLLHGGVVHVGEKNDGCRIGDRQIQVHRD